jgi:DNA helicase-2/ATP-dependent DNA helicase PcrA
MRGVAEETMALGRDLTNSEAQDILERDFYLPAANKPAHRQMKGAARSLVLAYLSNPEYRAELLRTWETERPFELILPGLAVSGRADVIFSSGEDGRTRLSLVDYKTSAHHGDFNLQLQVYANAGRREGLDVEAAFVHDLKSTERMVVPIDEGSVVESELALATVGDRLRARVYEPTKDGAVCAHCDVAKLCRYRK